MAVPAEIALHLVNIHELLRAPGVRNRKRILQAGSEEFIVEEAEALKPKEAIHIKIHLSLTDIKYKDDIAAAIHSHFCYRREQSQKKFKRELKYGLTILFIALVMLAVIFSLTEIVSQFKSENKLVIFIKESFIILGWVALWRPMELLLYDWYPIKREIQLFHRLEKSNVQVVLRES